MKRSLRCEIQLRGEFLYAQLTYNAAAAFRTERGKQLLNTGIRSLREHLCVYKVLVTAGKYYAIFDLEDLMAALGFPPKETLKFPKAAEF